jgi:hypothetical protein
MDVHVTGPAATVADLTVAGEHDRLPIEIAIGVLVLLVLLVVYRNPITMLLPLAAIGAALVTAQAVVAGVSDLFGIGVSNQSVIFLSAMIAGAGTDYAVFLISRYHDYLRQGADLDGAVKRALISIGKVITASAATVGITFLGCSRRSVWRARSGSGWHTSPQSHCCRPSWSWPGRAAGSSRGANSPLGSGDGRGHASCGGRRRIWLAACSC